MNKIVNTGMKIDLHIHSCFSSRKDGKKVINNTIKNISTLVKNLDSQKVNICSITDHDAFSYDMYKALKQSEKENNSIEKVLPGVEFSVRFKNEDLDEKVIHVIAIFSDENNEKVKNIEVVLKQVPIDENGSYSEEKFLEVLREINIDTILIAHQKNTLSSHNQRKNDANSLGNNKFLEFVYTDYFEAFEFKNKRNEILNKNFLLQENLEGNVRFVTGTDCHDWSIYPREDHSDNVTDFPYTYAKCLPTFKGLVMAITDSSRLKLVNSFFNVDKFVLENIKIKNNERIIEIPLSKGINVIIGDNSIGKSMILHSLTNFEKSGMPLPSSVKSGYKKYMKDNKLNISKQLTQANIFGFDMQGEVREKFEKNNLNATEFLSKYFTEDVNPKPYKSVVENEIDRMIDYLTKKFKIDSEIQQLNKFTIFVSEGIPESISFINNLRTLKSDTKDLDNIISKIKELEILLLQLKDLKLDDSDKEYILLQIDKVKELQIKYENRNNDIKTENDYIEKVARVIDRISKKHDRSISDRQKRETAFWDNSTELVQKIINIIKLKEELPSYVPYIEETQISPHCNMIHTYEFVSKLKIDEINTEYFISCINKVIKSKKKIDWKTITESKLKEMLLRYDGSTPVLSFFKEALLSVIENDFQNKQTIINCGMDKFTELSSGLDAQIYFDLLSYEKTKDGIYIIDQPEDNVSQKSIKTYLLDCFRAMGENRQVIMVTHNPQFIVNLDVDNIIYISKEAGIFKVQSGALEFVCDEYDVLDIVANNIDGGLDSIKKGGNAMKRIIKLDYKDNQYVLLESDNIIFSINENDLKFDSLKFYNGIYKGENKSVDIELNNEITNDPSKKGNYIFNWLNKIFRDIFNEIGDTNGNDNNVSKPEDSKKIPLFELSACAGDGFYIDERVQHSDYWVINQEADYAVKISGHSMEPKIPDGCIALVKQAQELNNNDVGIFNVDGQSMCKRYKNVGRGIVLVPDNNSGEYKSIKVSEVSSCVIQGKVVEIINE